jgi:hypothetical protein
MLLTIIAVDDRYRPTRSKMVQGPELPAEKVLRMFSALKTARNHPAGFPWLLLLSTDQGLINQSHLPPAKPAAQTPPADPPQEIPPADPAPAPPMAGDGPEPETEAEPVPAAPKRSKRH